MREDFPMNDLTFHVSPLTFHVANPKSLTAHGCGRPVGDFVQ